MNTKTSKDWKTLVIGYGNEMRGDDGIGIAVADLIAAKNLMGVRVITQRQLMPELADDIARAKRVIFVDATAETGKPNIAAKKLRAAKAQGESFAHLVKPEQLLGLCMELYQHETPAWLVAAPAFDFGHHAGLSSSAQCFVPQAVDKVEQLCMSSP